MIEMRNTLMFMKIDMNFIKKAKQLYIMRVSKTGRRRSGMLVSMQSSQEDSLKKRFNLSHLWTLHRCLKRTKFCFATW